MTPHLSPESLEQIRAIVASVVEPAVDTALARRFGELERRQDERFAGLQEGLAANRAELHAGLAENRRHFGVIAENLETKIDLVIEGQKGLRETMDRRFKETDARIDGLDRRTVRMYARLPVRRRKR